MDKLGRSAITFVTTLYCFTAKRGRGSPKCMNAIFSAPIHLYGSTCDIRTASFKPICSSQIPEKIQIQRGSLAIIRIEDNKKCYPH